jgi:protease-4
MIENIILKSFRIIKSVILLIFIAIFLGYFIVAGWLYWEFSRVPEVQQNSVLVLNIEGLIEDRPSADPASERLIGTAAKTRRQIINNIRKAAKDPRIIGILLKFGGYEMARTTAFDIQQELLTFKDSGKKVFAFMKNSGLRTYLLASAADKIYMPVSGTTFLMGLRIEIPFFKKMFDTIGVTPEFIAIGRYKTAPQIFTMDRISDEYREIMDNFLDALYAGFISSIAEARDVPEDQIITWIDDGLYSAQDALNAGMIDELVYESQLDKTVQRELGLVEESSNAENDQETPEEPKLHKINSAQYTRVKVNVPNLHNNGEKIAVIYARGSIFSGTSDLSSSGIGAESMTKLLSKLKKNEEIKGIILRIDSGGGGSMASDIIRHAIYEIKQKKPVIVSMAESAASGGYMIAAPADSIVAYPTTLTGSIGIFGGKFSLESLFDFIGIHIETLQRGENAGIFSLSEPWTAREKERLRKNIQQGYDHFIAVVAEGRAMTTEAVDDIAQGRVWTGKRALELGLVDKLGGLETAIELIKEKLEIPEDEDVQLVEFPKPTSLFKQLLKQVRQISLKTPPLPAEIVRLRDQLVEIARFQNETLFAWFPYQMIVE